MVDEHKYILSVDTATPCSTVALTTGSRRDGRVLGILSISSNVTHSRRLLVAIERLLADTGILKEELSGFAVGLGPGSFTGLRIGMATVKGLSAASAKPMYGVSTLDLAAANCTDSRLICSVLDARKKEVYTAFYRTDAVGQTNRITEIVAISPEALTEQITEPVLMVGDGLLAYGDYWQSQLGDQLTVAPAHLWSPSAATLGLMAGELDEPLDVGTATPLYVRASDAELNLQMSKEKKAKEVGKQP